MVSLKPSRFPKPRPFQSKRAAEIGGCGGFWGIKGEGFGIIRFNECPS